MTTARELRDATRRLLLAHGTLDDARRPCGAVLPIPHAYALIELLSAGPSTVSALAERLAIDRTNVSRLCLRLEAQGEVVRTQHPEDKRACLVQLTKQGQRAARAVDTSSADHFERVLARVGANAEHVVAALKILADALTEDHP